MNYDRENVYAKVDKPINRLVWRFSQGKQFIPNQNDIDALNEVIKWVNHEREKRLSNNHHFAKLFMFLYNEWTIKYENPDFPQSVICKILEKPLSYYYLEYRDTVNRQWFLDWCDNIGLNDSLNIKNEHKDFTVDDIRRMTWEDNKILKNVSNDEFLKNLERYSKEEVFEKLNTILSEALHRYEDVKEVEPFYKQLLRNDTASTAKKP